MLAGLLQTSDWSQPQKMEPKDFPGLHRDFSVPYNCLAGANPLTMPSVVPRVHALYTQRTFELPLDHSLKWAETMVSKHTAVNEGIRH